jgi:hypothetical protein
VGEPQSRSGRCGEDKILTLPGLELRPLGRPVHRQSLYRLSYPGSHSAEYKGRVNINIVIVVVMSFLVFLFLFSRINLIVLYMPNNGIFYVVQCRCGY